MIDSTALATDELETLVLALSRIGSGSNDARADGRAVDSAAGSDRVRVDQLAALERLKAAASAAQARLTAAFVDSQQQVAQAWRDRARECSAAGDFDGWRAAREHARASSFDDEGRAGSNDGRRRRRRRPSGVTGVAAQVALARRKSPVQGASHVRLALALTSELPHTMAALAAGELSEWRAQIIVRETAILTGEQRSLVDAEVVGGHRETLAGWGDRELTRQVRAAAYRIDALPWWRVPRRPRPSGESRCVRRPTRWPT